MTRSLRFVLGLFLITAPLGAQAIPEQAAPPEGFISLNATVRDVVRSGGASAGLVAGRNVITLGATRVLRFAPGQSIELPLVVTPTAGTNVAAFQTNLTWNPAVLTLDSVRASAPGSLNANTSNAASGAAIINWFNTTGSLSAVTVARLFFTAATAQGGTTLRLAPTQLAAEDGSALLFQSITRQSQACVAPPGDWGDANGDGNVNIIDAQQIARAAVLLPVARPDLVASQGDVTGDDQVDIVDAQQIARASVGLSAPARVGQSAFTAPEMTSVVVTPASQVVLPIGEVAVFTGSPRSADGTAWDGCVDLTWSSSSAAIATVDSIGVVRGIADGDATITASAGSAEGTGSVSVGAGAGTGLRLQVTSPIAASRYVVYVTATGQPSVLERVNLNFARSGTIDLELPAGTGRTVYVFAGDSGAVNPDAAVSVSAGKRFSDVTIVDGQRTLLDATLEPMGIATTYPTTVEQGSPYAVTSVLTDPSGLWYGLITGLTLFRSDVAPTVDRSGSGINFTGATTLNETQRQFSGEPFRPTIPGTIYGQVSSRITFGGGIFSMDLTDRAIVRGEDLAQTTVTTASTGLQITVTSSVPNVDRFLVAVDTVGGSTAWGTLSGAALTSGVVTVPLPPGDNYRVRIAAVDEQFFTPVTNATYSEIRAGKQLLGQTVNAEGGLTALEVSLDPVGLAPGIPATGQHEIPTAFSGTGLNPSHFIPNNCVYRWSTAGPITFENLGTVVSGAACVVSNRQPDGRYSVSGTLPAVPGPAAIYTQFFPSVIGFGPSGERYEMVQTVFTQTDIAAPVTTGVRINITSPEGASRYMVLVSGGGQPSALYKFTSNYARTQTVSFAHPPVTGAQIRIVAVDSLARNPDNQPLVAAGYRFTNQNVIDGQVLELNATLEPVTTTHEISPTASAGAPLTAAVTLRDPSFIFTPVTWANVYVTESQPTIERGVQSVQLTDVEILSDTTKRFTGTVFTPLEPGTVYTQSAFGVGYGFGTTFWTTAPSVERGEPLVETVISESPDAATLTVNATALAPHNIYLVAVDQGPGTPAILKSVATASTASISIPVPVAIPGTYRVRVAALDSALVLSPTLLSAEVKEGNYVNGIPIGANATVDLNINLAAASSNVVLPTTAFTGSPIQYNGTARDPALINEGEICIARFTATGTLYQNNNFGTISNACVASNRQPDGTRNINGSIPSQANPATLSSQVIMSRAYLLPGGQVLQANQFSALSSINVVAAPTTGLRLNITSPEGSSRYYAYVTGGALGAPQLTKLQTNFARTPTMLVPLPAGSGYRVRVLAADSLAATPDADVLIAAGGEAADVSVTEGALTTVALTLEPVVVDVSIPTTGTEGQAVPVEVTLTDPTRTLGSIATSVIAYADWGPFAADRGSPSVLFDSVEVVETDRVRRFVGQFTPARNGTLYSQFGFGLNINGTIMRMLAPSLQRGEPLRQTVVSPSTSFLEVAVNSPVPVNQFLVTVDTGFGGAPVVAELRGTAMTSGVVSLPVPIGTGYRIRAAAADSSFNLTQSRYLALLRAGAVLDGVDVPSDGVNLASIDLVAISRSITATPTTTVGNDIVVSGTFTDPSRLTPEDGICAVRYNDAGQIPNFGLGVLQTTCTASNLQADGTFSFNATISGRSEPGERWWLALMNSSYLLPTGRTIELDNSARGSTIFTAP